MKPSFKEMYEAPKAEVLVVKMESGILSVQGVQSQRSSYGTASRDDGTIQDWD